MHHSFFFGRNSGYMATSLWALMMLTIISQQTVNIVDSSRVDRGRTLHKKIPLMVSYHIYLVALCKAFAYILLGLCHWFVDGTSAFTNELLLEICCSWLAWAPYSWFCEATMLEPWLKVKDYLTYYTMSYNNNNYNNIIDNCGSMYRKFINKAKP